VNTSACSLDIDNFKTLNDSVGSYGDRVLIAIARRLEAIALAGVSPRGSAMNSHWCSRAPLMPKEYSPLARASCAPSKHRSWWMTVRSS
jgi:hypothetical protein